MYGRQVSAKTSVTSRICILHRLIFDHRVFLAEARLILLRMVWNFDFELASPENYDWMDQRAYLVFEPKALMVKLKENVLA